MSFHATEHLPGVWQIAGPMGVCSTLIAGGERALLVDAGYGLEDLAAFVRTLTDRPVQLLLTHGHHDHALGAMDFDAAWLFPEDEDVYRTYTGRAQRLRVADSAEQAGRVFDRERFLSAPMPPTSAPPACADLGGLTAMIILCPAHTPGSAVVYVPERELLLTGDDWNPVTWCFFPECLPVRTWRANVRALLTLPFTRVLCSHREELWSREDLEAFLNAMTDEALRRAQPTDEGKGMGIRTCKVVVKDGERFLIFDRDKFTEE